jgi:hypothetical protein
VLSYPNTEIIECSSDSFTTIDIAKSEDNMLIIDYTGLIGENTATVSITCTNWKNPILPEMTSGFTIKTLDKSGYVIDESEEFSFDGTSL